MSPASILKRKAPARCDQRGLSIKQSEKQRLGVVGFPIRAPSSFPSRSGFQAQPEALPTACACLGLPPSEVLYVGTIRRGRTAQRFGVTARIRRAETHRDVGRSEPATRSVHCVDLLGSCVPATSLPVAAAIQALAFRRFFRTRCAGRDPRPFRPGSGRAQGPGPAGQVDRQSPALGIPARASVADPAAASSRRSASAKRPILNRWRPARKRAVRSRGRLRTAPARSNFRFPGWAGFFPGPCGTNQPPSRSPFARPQASPRYVSTANANPEPRQQVFQVLARVVPVGVVAPRAWIS